jgi:hypothetical protein
MRKFVSLALPALAALIASGIVRSQSAEEFWEPPLGALAPENLARDRHR